MNKIDLHLHLTLNQLPKQNNMFISSAENMIPHLENLGIKKGVLMSGGEKQFYSYFNPLIKFLYYN